MFIRTTTRTYKGKTYTNHLLVESVHTPKGPRQRTVCSLGDLRPRPAREWLKLAHKVEEALCGQGQLFEDEDDEVEAIVAKARARQQCDSELKSAGRADRDEVVGVLADAVETQCHREAGAVHVGYRFWKRLGLDSILEDLGLGGRARDLACVLMLNRLIAPRAEYAIPDWVRTTALGDILEADFEQLSEDALYRAMDRLEPHRAAIESALVERETELFNLDRTVFFYDLTSTYFEGLARKNRKAKRGYSRDKRPDCKQVVVALVVNRDGFPLAHEVFEGNTQDRKTLEAMLALIEQRIGLEPGQTVVVDRGMAYPENIETLRNHPKKLHYIVAARQSERDQWLEEFEALEGFEPVIRIPSPRNPFQKKSSIRVKLKRGGGETHVLCLSAERVAKDKAIRQKQEKRFLDDLAKLAKRIEDRRLVQPVKIGEAIGRIKERYPRVARYYQIAYKPDENNKLSYLMDPQKMAKAEQLDGSYLLKSDRADLTAEEAWRIYMLLTRAENAFRNMKSPLCMRPIHHQTERRTDTHIFLSLMAYHILVAIEKTLLDQGIHTSWDTLRAILSTHQVCTVVLPTDNGAVLKIRKASTPEAGHKKIYELLGIDEHVMEPQKTWTLPSKRKI